MKSTQIINFYDIFTLLKEWFDTPTPPHVDFSEWRSHLYEQYSSASIPRLPLKTWWPHYTKGDYRFELCIGALLVHQTSWRQVERSIKGIEERLIDEGKAFDAEEIAGIPLPELESLIRSTGFYRQKARRVRGFSKHVFDNYGTISRFMEWGREQGRERCGTHLRSLGAGFGPETRDSVLLYAVNIPVFVADSYARKLMVMLRDEECGKYDVCQRRFVQGIERDFSRKDIDELMEGYMDEELAFVLPNLSVDFDDTEATEWEDISRVLLYQQFHAGIDELGISKRWKEFVEELDR